MMHLVPKWTVIVTFVDREVTVWIHDDHIANVLRQVAGMQFTANSLESPVKITVSAS
jgi:hypothetical protein